MDESFPNGVWISLSANFNQLGTAGFGFRFGKQKSGLVLLQSRIDRRTYVIPSDFIVHNNSRILWEHRLSVSGQNDYFKVGSWLQYSREPFLTQELQNLNLTTFDVPSVGGRGAYVLFRAPAATANIGAEASYYVPNWKNGGSTKLSSGYGYGGSLEVELGKNDKTKYVINAGYRWKVFSSTLGEPKSKQLSVWLELHFAP